MKKFFLWVIFSLLVIVSCYAQTGVEYKDVQLDADKLSEANADLAQIEIDFCDKLWEKGIEYTMSPGWSQDVCLKASNVSSQDIEVTIWFVDGTVTNDERQNKACMQQWDENVFWRYMTGFESSFIIPASGFVFKHATIQLEKNNTWNINWCLVYYTKSVEMWGGLNFSVLMRKAKFIDIQIRENIFVKKYLFRMLAVLLLMYYAKIFFWKQKKLPKK